MSVPLPGANGFQLREQSTVLIQPYSIDIKHQNIIDILNVINLQLSKLFKSGSWVE